MKISLSSWLTWLKVLRDGDQKEIEASELVVGDIVYFKGGDKQAPASSGFSISSRVG